MSRVQFEIATGTKISIPCLIIQLPFVHIDAYKIYFWFFFSVITFSKYKSDKKELLQDRMNDYQQKRQIKAYAKYWERQNQPNTNLTISVHNCF